MGKPKEKIEVAKFVELAEMLGDLQAAMLRLVEECKVSNVTTIELEGWPTLVRGFQFMIDQGKKIVGPLPLRNIDSSRLLMPGQSYAPTRKPPKAVQERATNEAAAKLAEAHKQVAESKKPYKKPPKDTPEP